MKLIELLHMLNSALKCETLAIVFSLVLLALMLALCFLSCSRLCTDCSLVSVALLVIFSNWLCQTNFGRLFSWLDTHVHKIYTLSALVVHQLDIVGIPSSEV